MGVRINGMRKVDAAYNLVQIESPTGGEKKPIHHLAMNGCGVHRRAFVMAIRMMIVREVLDSRVWSDPRQLCNIRAPTATHRQ